MSEQLEKTFMNIDLAIDLAFMDIEERFNGNIHVPVSFIVGKPGGAKTALVQSECQKRGWNFYTRNIGMMPYEEFSGIPENINENGNLSTRWAMPQIVDDLNTIAESGNTVCFLDDWHLSSTAVQSLGFELWSAHTLKGYKISDKIAFICAGNDSTSAGARNQLSALLNRVSKKYVKLPYSYWKNNFAYANNIHPLILGFLDSPDYQAYFHMEESMFEPWASPRSWTYLSTKLHILDKNNIQLSPQDLIAEVASYVGMEASAQLQRFFYLYRSINTENIFKTGHYTIPEDPILRYIFVHAVCIAFITRWTEKKDISVAQILSSIIKDMFGKYPEIAIQFISHIVVKHPGILEELIRLKLISREIAETMLQLTSAMGNLEKTPSILTDRQVRQGMN